MDRAGATLAEKLWGVKANWIKQLSLSNHREKRRLTDMLFKTREKEGQISLILFAIEKGKGTLSSSMAWQMEGRNLILLAEW